MNARKELVLFFSMSLLLLGCYEMQRLYSDRLRVLGKQPFSSFVTVVQMDRPENPIPETVMEEPTDPPTRHNPFSSSTDHFQPGSLDTMMEIQNLRLMTATSQLKKLFTTPLFFVSTIIPTYRIPLFPTREEIRYAIRPSRHFLLPQTSSGSGVSSPSTGNPLSVSSFPVRLHGRIL